MRFKEIKQQNIKGLQSNALTADFTNKHLSGETHICLPNDGAGSS